VDVNNHDLKASNATRCYPVAKYNEDH